jgi:hypothetical protein
MELLRGTNRMDHLGHCLSGLPHFSSACRSSDYLRPSAKSIFHRLLQMEYRNKDTVVNKYNAGGGSTSQRL